MANKVFGTQMISVEIDGNAYRIPDTLTPGLRVKYAKEIRKHDDARQAYDDARQAAERAHLRHLEEGTQASEEAYKKAQADFKKADGDAFYGPCREIVVALLESADKSPIPDDIGLHIADDMVLEYCNTVLVARERVEVDPQ